MNSVIFFQRSLKSRLMQNCVKPFDLLIEQRQIPADIPEAVLNTWMRLVRDESGEIRQVQEQKGETRGQLCFRAKSRHTDVFLHLEKRRYGRARLPVNHYSLRVFKCVTSGVELTPIASVPSKSLGARCPKCQRCSECEKLRKQRDSTRFNKIDK